MTQMVDINIVQYCASEVERQGDCALAVAGMFRAWSEIELDWFARTASEATAGIVTIDEPLIFSLNAYIRGIDEAFYRQTPVTFKRGGYACDWPHVPRQMMLLLENQHQIDIEEFTRRFLEIHPFEDGNGRVASLLRNAKMNNLYTPELLPNYF